MELGNQIKNTGMHYPYPKTVWRKKCLSQGRPSQIGKMTKAIRM